MSTQVDEARERLAKRIDEGHPEAFVFDDQQAEFVGWFRSLKRAPSKYGVTPVAVFEDHTTGEMRSVWLHHTVLRNALAEAAPVPGELVMIRYLGREIAEQSGSSYANYRVAVDRPNAPGLAWDDISFAADTVAADEAAVNGHADDGDDIPF